MSGRIVMLSGAAAALAGALAVIGGDGAIPASDGTRAWLMKHGFSSDGVVEFAAQNESASPDPARLRNALQIYRVLLDREPANPYRWCDVAEAAQLAGDPAEARKAFQRAAALGPAIPPVQARAGNFYFAAGDRDAAVASYKTVLSLVHDYDRIIFLNLGRLGLTPRQVAERALPKDRETAANYLAYSMGPASIADTDAVWQWIRANGLANDGLAAQYTDYLLRSNSGAHAAELWADYSGSRRGDYLRPNMLFNGDFQNAPAPGRLDWQIQPAEGVDASIEPADVGRALHLQFQGRSNVDYHHVFQVVALSPGRYRFRARVRSQGLTTNSGVQFYLADSTGKFQWTTEPVTGTHPWSWIDQELTVPQAPYQTLQIVRRPSEKFDNKIEGSIWITNVSLVKL